MRKLKHHEAKLLKKTNFFSWEGGKNVREAQIVHRYQLVDREDYGRYNKLAGSITSLVSMLRKLPANDGDRIKMTEMLLEKLHTMGLIASTQSLDLCVNIPTSAFCRRRLSTVLVYNKFVERISEAVKFVQQGHVALGANVVTDPATLVTRDMEDLIKWSEGSKIKRKVNEFANTLDDYEIDGI
jgi:U3 small nucleolar ribonucleoprotein protein IMP3